jgi:serine/threonine protein kinase
MNGQDQSPANDDAGQSAPLREAPSPAKAVEPSPINPPTVSDYELIRRIGHGAYGDVWLARSNATGALRAAKIVWRHTFENERPFKREFEGIQRFERISREHPSQLALFHIGRNDAEGYFYYVMELADAAKPRSEDGGLRMEDSDGNQPLPGHPQSSIFNLLLYTPHTLRADLEKGRLPAASVLAIGLALSEALSHLHSHGLVHRDVKPSNVIFVNGRPKLADIGLVTDASDQCSIVGTEGYLPPEGPGTPQADIFALGKVLYEAATGLDRRDFPKLPEDLLEWPDYRDIVELNEIVLRACAKDPDDRYPTCQAMHADLALLGEGKSVKQKRIRQQRWAVAKKVLATAALLGVLVASWAMLLRQPASARHVEKRSTNEVANHAFDMGKAQFDIFKGTNFALAADYFQRAILADTNFAQAYGFLAATYFWSDDSWNPDWQFLPKAKEVALKALALDNTLAEPHLALGWYRTLEEWDWNNAEQEYKRALQLNPSSAFCHLSYAEYLRVAGRVPEALNEINEAKSLDAHSRIINIRLADYLIDAKQFSHALEQVEQVLAMGPNPDTAYTKQNALCALGRYEEALDAEREYRVTTGESNTNLDQELGELKRAVAADGPTAYWWRELENSKNRTDTYGQACAFVQLGHTNEAFASLRQSLQNRDVGLTFMMKTDWRLDPIRSDPRFHAILKTMRLE